MVNNLLTMCKKNISYPFTFYCYTDNPEGIDQQIKILEYVENGLDTIVFNKLYLFSKDINEKIPSGNRLYFDLDLVIKSNIDDIAQHTNGEICLIDAEWRSFTRDLLNGHGVYVKTDLGFPWFLHPFNSSCITWKDNIPEKIWNFLEKDPEFFLTKYRFGMDSFLFYEKESMKVDIKHFPPRKFHSFLMGIDAAENLIYDKIENAYYGSKQKHIAEEIPIILFNGPTEKLYPNVYENYFKKYYPTL